MIDCIITSNLKHFRNSLKRVNPFMKNKIRKKSHERCDVCESENRGEIDGDKTGISEILGK